MAANFFAIDERVRFPIDRAKMEDVTTLPFKLAYLKSPAIPDY